MKKKVLAVLLCVATVASLTACKGGDSNTESTEVSETTSKRSGQFDIDAEECVTSLCDYSAVPVEVDSSYEVTEDAKNNYLTELLSGYGGDAYVENTSRTTVEAGDYVKVNYTGYLDDEAFDGGSAENVLIDVDNNKTVGSSTGFIDGFSDGLIGATVGATVDCAVTFPEDYSSETLAGQDAVFEFEILGIYTTNPVTFDDLTDEIVNDVFSEYTSITNVADFEEAVESDLNNSLYSATVDSVKAYMLDNCTVEIPEEYLQARLNEYEASLESDYCTETQTLEEYIAANGSQTFEEYEETWKESLEEQIKTELIFSVIATKEDIEFDEDGFNSYIEYIISNSSDTFEDANAVYEYFGSGYADEGEAYLKNQYLVNLAVDKVAENAVVSYAEEETTESTEE